MNILSIDIGGTYCRFGDFAISDGTLAPHNDPFKVPTRSEKITSLEALISFFNIDKPDGFDHIRQYDLIVLGVAGPIMDKRCSPPNIGWEIDLNTFTYKDHTVLINDFVAQAYGLVYPDVMPRLVKVGTHERALPDGNIAVIGPGTGLGHCCLVPQGNGPSNPYLHVPSESGHTTFAFHGRIEKELEQYFIKKKRVAFCSNDDVVSGSGLALIHEFLTDESIDPMLIDGNDGKFKETIRLFSRLFGRACKNYCLSTLATQSLIVTGGVAIHNPGVVNSTDFYEEFVNSKHSSILSSIYIYRNPGIETGLLGGAYYGMRSISG